MIKQAYMEKLLDGKWRVYSRKGKNLGTYHTKEEAKERLRQVEYFKHMKKASEITNTYSAVMRDLRKNNPKELSKFMECFKSAFDQALEEKLDDPEQIALLEACQKIDYES